MKNRVFLVLLLIAVLSSACHRQVVENKSTVWLVEPQELDNVRMYDEDSILIRKKIKYIDGQQFVTELTMYDIVGNSTLHIMLTEDGVLTRTYKDVLIQWDDLFIANTPFNILIGRRDDILLIDVLTGTGRMFYTYFERDITRRYAMDSVLFMYEQQKISKELWNK